MKKRHISHITSADIAPDEIFLDDRNIPEFDVQQFEGRIETPIERRTIFFLALAFIGVGLVLLGRAGILELLDGEVYAAKSEQNRLEHQLLFPERGIIYDWRGTPLAWNVPSAEELGFSLRMYTETPGFAHLLGFLHYPARDKQGVYYRKDYEAPAGVEAYYNDLLKGMAGLRIIETDALGNVMSSNMIDPPSPGSSLRLSIDGKLQAELYAVISAVARDLDYLGGAGAIMDIESGAMRALVSYPEYEPNIMTSGDDNEAIEKWSADEGTPFLNRAVSGLFTPGSIIKPILAVGALRDGILTPETLIQSVGYIAVPNPYFPKEETRFNDWKAHGWLDMRTAIAQSSNVYFYEVAGGYKEQRGLGIANIEKYARLFGYGTTTGIDLYGEGSGTIPTPRWKIKNFPDDPTWRIGDTYFTGIGQYGVQVTLLQALREAAIIASKGIVVRPHVREAVDYSADSSPVATSTSAMRISSERFDPEPLSAELGAEGLQPNPSISNGSYRLPIPQSYFTVVGEGMRKGVVEGTAKLLNIPGIKIAAKTGTAELGVSKSRVNSWVIGFFPYDKPKYAFAVVMDRGMKGNTTNASYVAQQLFWWMTVNTPEYFTN
ncbi:MAG: penicillin-binding transpeptidase domain-containing protein [Patescibacteria group bacterium]